MKSNYNNKDAYIVQTTNIISQQQYDSSLYQLMRLVYVVYVLVFFLPERRQRKRNDGLLPISGLVTQIQGTLTAVDCVTFHHGNQTSNAKYASH
jgi:hypothetical protein